MSTPQVMTVRGPVSGDAGALQWALPHEHVFHRIHETMVVPAASTLWPDDDGRSTTDAGDDGGSSSSMVDIFPQQLQPLRVSPWKFQGKNLTLTKEDEAFRELELLGSTVAGAGVIVDVTGVQEGRDPTKLRRLAERLDAHIVMSTSVDLQALTALPSAMSMQEKSERLAKSIETELLFGIPDAKPALRAGIIYQQIHCESTAMSENEEVVAKALALTQVNNTVPVYLSFTHGGLIPSDHAFRSRILTWIDVLIAFGASPKRLVVCFADRWSEEADGTTFLATLGKRGVMLSFGLIGLYTVSDVVLINSTLSPPDVAVEPPQDRAIAGCLASLIQNHGLLDQLLVSSNVHQRVQYQRYGGGGYRFALHDFKQRLARDAQLTETQWGQLIGANPLQLLEWYKPPAAAPIPKHFLQCSICEQHFEPIVGEYFTKFAFVYCGTKCLRKHSKLGFKQRG